MAPCLSLFSPLFAMRRPGVRIPSRPPSFKRPRACQTVLPRHARTRCYVQDDAGNGLEPVIHLINRIRVLLVRSLPDSFRYLVIHPERHCLNAASSVNTSRLIAVPPRARFSEFGDLAQKVSLVRVSKWHGATHAAVLPSVTATDNRTERLFGLRFAAKIVEKNFQVLSNIIAGSTVAAARRRTPVQRFDAITQPAG